MKRQTLTERVEALKQRLPAPDILVYTFSSLGGTSFALLFTDGLTDKQMMGELLIKPLSAVKTPLSLSDISSVIAVPEVKTVTEEEGVKSVVNGNVLLLADGESTCLSLGLRVSVGRAVAEPPTQIVVKGPREGFVEEIKVNLALVRKRLKTPRLTMEKVTLGRQTGTEVCIVYLQGIGDRKVVQDIVRQLSRFDVDGVADSSYIAKMLKGNKSLFKHCGSTEKPDVFCAKLCEGRVGVIVDGSPIALTLPYLLTEDFQSPEDYFIVHQRATVVRFIRLIAVLVGVLLPALYISAQLYKVQLIPYKLLVKISSSVSGIPLSPSIEMFLTLFVLEVLNEASVRMPKYVGLTLSVVGALVLGDTAVKAGVISTPAIIIVAFSTICLYAVPDLIDSSSMVRWLYLLVSGSVGTFGIVLLTAFLMCYLVEERSYGAPLLAPFAPLVSRDLRDGLFKADYFTLDRRPQTLKSHNRRRLSVKEKS